MNPFQARGDGSIVSAKRKTAAWIKEGAKSSPGGRTETSPSEMSADKSSRLAQRAKPGSRQDVLYGGQDLLRPPQSCFWVRTAEDRDTFCGPLGVFPGQTSVKSNTSWLQDESRLCVYLHLIHPISQLPKWKSSRFSRFWQRWVWKCLKRETRWFQGREAHFLN